MKTLKQTTGLNADQWDEVTNKQIYRLYTEVVGAMAGIAYGEACKELVDLLGQEETYTRLTDLPRW